MFVSLLNVLEMRSNTCRLHDGMSHGSVFLYGERQLFQYLRTPRREHRFQPTESAITTTGPEYEYEYVYEYVYEDDYDTAKGPAERGKSKNDKFKNKALDSENVKEDAYMWKKRGWSECSVTCGEGEAPIVYFLGQRLSRLSFLVHPCYHLVTTLSRRAKWESSLNNYSRPRVACCIEAR